MKKRSENIDSIVEEEEEEEEETAAVEKDEKEEEEEDAAVAATGNGDRLIATDPFPTLSILSMIPLLLIEFHSLFTMSLEKTRVLRIELEELTLNLNRIESIRTQMMGMSWREEKEVEEEEEEEDTAVLLSVILFSSVGSAMSRLHNRSRKDRSPNTANCLVNTAGICERVAVDAAAEDEDDAESSVISPTNLGNSLGGTI